MKITLILPSVDAGGLERVITELAHYFAGKGGLHVVIVSLSKGRIFYPLPEGISTYMPSFSSKRLLRLLFLARLFFWLRGRIRSVEPDILLCFGGKFNSFVLLSVYGLPVRVFVSDRSRPSIRYGRFLDWFNPIMYRKAAGIIAQTERAKRCMYIRTGHSNIRVIGNPLRMFEDEKGDREKIILNVGRFIHSKKQELLVRFVAQIQPRDWKLCLIGNGPHLNEVKRVATELGIKDKMVFPGVVGNLEAYYRKSSIFAFTSVSEGFPNALGEAMSAGLACISFDCEAGPSELIQDGINGFLVPENDHDRYLQKLTLLVEDESLREKLGVKARASIEKYSTEKIGQMFLDFFNQHHG